MKKSSIIFILALTAVAAGAYFLSRVDDIVNNLLYRFSGLRVKKIDLSGAALELEYSITNNNQFPISVNWVKGAIYYGSTAVADLNISEPTQLVTAEEKALKTVISVKWLDSAGDLFEILRNSKTPGANPYKPFIARGNINASLQGKSYIIPFDQVLRLSDS